MGRKMDALLGRGFKPSKFKALVNLSISRLAVLKKPPMVRSTQARSDVIQLLQIGQHDSALLRVEQVIKEQKKVDAYLMLESYINIVVERVDLVEHHRECPDELREAVSGLMYASSRCGDFPELQELRTVFTSRFGKQFAASSIELRNNCAVNPQLIQKMSGRQPDLETKMKVLKEIASENNIVLQLEEASTDSIKENPEASNHNNRFEPGQSSNSINPERDSKISPDSNDFPDSTPTRRKYRDVADAAEAAFQSAAHAAAAARAAVELSRFKPHYPDGPDSPNTRPRKIPSIKEENKENDTDLKRDMSLSSTDSGGDNLALPTMSFDGAEQAKLLDKDLVFDESDNEEIYPYEHETLPEKDRKSARMGNVPFSARTRQVRGY